MMEGDRYIVTSGSDSDSSESYSDGSGDDSYSDSSCNSESSRYYGTYSDSLQSDSESSESCRSTSSSGDSSDDTHSHSSESSYCASRSSSSSLADREAQRQSTADKPEESDPENSHRLPESSVDVDPSLHRPLYSGSRLTVLESCLLLLQLLLRFQISNTAFEELLKVISIHLPVRNNFVGSTYKLKKVVSKVFPQREIIKNNYCKVCQKGIQGQELCSICGNGIFSKFITTDLACQLKQRFQDPHFWTMLQSRPSSNDNSICDVYDGAEYKQYSSYGGFLCKLTNPANVSFIMNTDGIAIFRSVSTDVWPVYLAVNELPIHARFNKKYMLLCGVWYGKEKPSMLTFLRPVIEQINQLYNQGVQVCTPNGLHTCKAMLLACSVDLPARALVTNMNQFNGAYSCCTCEDKGDNTLGSTPLQRVWPYSSSNVVRSNVYAAIREATVKGKTVMGYKGVPILAIHPPFDLVKGIVTDYLHCVLLGVSKMLLNLWLKAANRSKAFFVGDKDKEIDQRMLKIEVPDVVKRKPRSIEERKHWKGSEWQAWLLIYSLPVQDGILPTPYLQQYAKFVVGIAILLGANLSNSDLERAHHLLCDFYKALPEIYDDPLLTTMNIHMLRHLTFHVRNFGPLWAFSCFGFESLNGDIKKLFHGTRNMSEQVMSNFSIMQAMATMEQFPVLSPLCKTYLHRIMPEHRRRGKKTKRYGPKSWRIGFATPHNLDTTETELVVAKCGFIPEKVSKFFRFQLHDNIIYSCEYSRTTKANSYTVSYATEETGIFRFGMVQCFLELTRADKCSVVAIVNRLCYINGVRGCAAHFYSEWLISRGNRCISNTTEMYQIFC